MEPKLITTLEDFEATFVEKGTYRLLRGEYAYGGMAVMAQDENGEPAFVLSVFLENREPEPGYFWAKDYSENEGIVEELERRGIVEKVGREAISGYVVLSLYRLTEEYR